MGGVRKFLALVPVALVLLLPAPGAATSSGRPVALVTAETANEVLAVSLGKYGGHIIRRVHLVDPLMIASARHGPAVVVNPRGTVTLLAWHSLRPIKVFHGFSSPKVAEVAPNGQLAYVTDERTGDLTVINLARRRIVGRVFVGLQAHHFAISPDGSLIWVALGETATTIVRLEASNPRKPLVVGRIHPPHGAHDVGFTPDGKLAWVTSPTATQVEVYSAAGKLLEGAKAGRGPQHVAFSGSSALVSSGYGSSLESIAWRAPYHRLLAVTVPYGSFNLATYSGFVVTTSLFTGQVTELRVRDLHRLWTTRVAPAARYVAISLWPR
jgi:DNA-binding beta-propeller fold protein YncE